MKKHIMSSILILGFCIFAAGQTPYNKVYWVHGLGDLPAKWDSYKYSLTESDNQGTSIKWYMAYSLNAAASTLDMKIKTEVPSSKKAIVFGHSAGGLVARSAATKSGSRIRAIVTAGTPNAGAGIVTSIQNSSFNNVAEDAICRAERSLDMGLQAVGLLLPGVGNAICTAIAGCVTLGLEVGKSLATEAIDETKKAYSSCAAVTDMDPNHSEFLQTLNGTAPSVPIINLYGNEDADRLVRIGGTYWEVEQNNSPTDDNQCYDESLFSTYNGVLGTCTTFEVLHYAAGATTAAIAFCCPYLWASSAMNFAAAASWTGTRRYVQYDVHNDWDKIIGATHVDRIEKWHKFLWWKWSTVSYVTVYENSDGFIPNKSSIMDETQGPFTRNYEIKGVNHLEMNSHEDMENKLRTIYNGEINKLFDPDYN